MHWELHALLDRVYIRSYIHTYRQTDRQTYVCVCACTDLHTCMYNTHMYVCIYIYCYMNIHLQTLTYFCTHSKISHCKCRTRGHAQTDRKITSARAEPWIVLLDCWESTICRVAEAYNSTARTARKLLSTGLQGGFLKGFQIFIPHTEGLKA